jgi:dephospho-CoA kinase
MSEVKELPSRVFGVVGLSGTGKSEAVRYLSALLSLEPVYFGGVVIKEVSARNLPVNELSEAGVRTELRRTHGMAAMAILSRAAIEERLRCSGTALIDGIYSMAEYKFLKEIYPDLQILAMHSTKAVRYNRLRSRPIRPLEPQEVDERDVREVEELDKAGPIALADYHFVNDKSIDELHEFLSRLA